MPPDRAESVCSLLAQGKPNQARVCVERAVALGREGGDRMVHMRAGLAQAEVDIDSGRPLDAERDLNRIQARAKRDGFVP